MTSKRLREWVIPSLGLIVLIGTIIMYYLVGKIINYDLVPEDTYVTNPLIDTTLEVQKEIDLKIVKPFVDEKVTISKYFYTKKDEESKQEKSLIRYENIYMPNTGILYSSDSEFNVVAVLDGKVTSVKSDEILGNIIEIEHEKNLVTIYQSVKEVKVNIGDNVTQGDIIATSGPNKLNGEKTNCLHFETYQDGTLINPEDFYNIDLSK